MPLEPSFVSKSAPVLASLSRVKSVSLDRFICCRPVKKAFTCLGCSQPIYTTTSVVPEYLKCGYTECGANNFVAFMTLTCETEVAFHYEDEKVWVKLSAPILKLYIDIINTPAADIDKILTTMTNIELRFNEKSLKIVDVQVST